MSEQRSREGFTFVEILVVVILIGILAALGIPRYMNGVENSRADIARGVVSQIGVANRSYKLDNGNFVAGGQIPTDNSCNGAIPNPCNNGTTCALVFCRYLPSQDWSANAQYYNFSAGQNCGCGALSAGATAWVACASRMQGNGQHQTQSNPYQNYAYAMDDAGVLTACGGAPPGP